MHVRIIHQYFKTPDTGGGLRTYYLSKELVRRGFQVSVITATNEEKAATYPVGEVTVYALPVYYSNHLGFYSRVGAFIRYVVKTFRLLQKLPPADLNYVLTTPLTTGIIAQASRQFLKQPYIFEVGDLWPDAPIALGILQNKLLIGASRWLEKTSYRNASGLVGLSPPITNHLKNAAPGIPAITITNMASQKFEDLPRSNTLRESLNIPKEAFVICYTGTIGLANHLEYLVDAMDGLNGHFACIVMGSGARSEAIKELAVEREVKMHFLPHGDQQSVKSVLAESDAMYISFAKNEILATGSPNKFFDGLAAGKIIIANFRGWIGEIIEKEGLGFTYNPEKPEEFRKGLNDLAKNPQKRMEMSANAKELAQKKYSPEVQVNILESFLKDLPVI